MVSRGMVALAFLLVLVAPGIAQDRPPAGRITATFYLAQGAAQRSMAGTAMPDTDKEAKPDGASMGGPFKVDPEAPVHIEADSVFETSDGQARIQRRRQAAPGRLPAPYAHLDGVLPGPVQRPQC